VSVRLDLATGRRCELVDVTDAVGGAVRQLGLEDGAVLLHVPHTTAAVTVNEGYDPDVAGDLLRRLEHLAPHGADTAGGRDRHAEGNSDSHLKAALVGTSTLVPVQGGSPPALSRRISSSAVTGVGGRSSRRVQSTKP
jgi:secondary thiamine-phosphate synthase enzyme